MKSYFIAIILSFLSYTSFGQRQDYTWLLGNAVSKGIGLYYFYPETGISVLKFKDLGKLEMYRDTNFGIYFYGSNSSMSDANGDFLFAFNEYNFHNKYYKDFGENGIYSEDNLFVPSRGPQGNIIVPTGRGDDSYYAIYNTTKYGEFEGFLDGYADSLRYSEVDLSMNNGQGGVTETNEFLKNDTIGLWKLSEVRHANG